MTNNIKKITSLLLAILAFLSFLASCTSGAPKTDEWTGAISIEDADDYLLIHTPYGEEKIRFKSITEVIYQRQWESGELVDGIENNRVKSGVFTLDGTDYHLHIYTGIDRFVVLMYNGNTLVFNLEDSDELLEWKDRIIDKVF